MRRLAPPNHINPVVSLAKVSESQETTATMLSVATHMGQAKVRKSKSGLILLTLGIGTVVGVVAGFVSARRGWRPGLGGDGLR